MATDRGEWQATVPGVTNSRTQLSDFTFTLAQQPERCALTQARTLVKGNTANIYIDNRYVFRGAYDFGILWKQCGFPYSSRNEI